MHVREVNVTTTSVCRVVNACHSALVTRISEVLMHVSAVSDIPMFKLKIRRDNSSSFQLSMQNVYPRLDFKSQLFSPATFSIERLVFDRGQSLPSVATKTWRLLSDRWLRTQRWSNEIRRLERNIFDISSSTETNWCAFTCWFLNQTAACPDRTWTRS